MDIYFHNSLLARSFVMKSYIFGFVSSILLTVVAFGLAMQHVNTGHESPGHGILIPAIIILAITQLIVQLVCFLHLGRESKPRYNLTVFAFMLLVVVLLVGGSLWIMANLDYHGMHNKDIEEEIIHDEGMHH